MKQAIIFGAGNIGRGFIGQLYSESDYEVTFVDVDRPLLDTLNERGRYTIRLVTNEQTEEVTVGPVRALHSGDLDAVAEAVSRARNRRDGGRRGHPEAHRAGGGCGDHSVARNLA